MASCYQPVWEKKSGAAAFAIAAGVVVLSGACLPTLAAEPYGSLAPKTAPRFATSVSTSFHRVQLVLNKSKVIRLRQSVGDVLIGNSEIADVLPVSDQSLYVLGKKIGTTNVTLFDAEKRLVGIVDVVVSPDVSEVQQQVFETTRDTRLRVRAAGEKTVLTGTAHDAVTVDRAMQAAPAGTVNLTRVSSPQQVMLKVRFVEVNRTAARQLGLRWDRFARNQVGVPASTIGQGQTTTSIDKDIGGLVRTASSAIPSLSPFVTILATFGGYGRGLDVQLNAMEEKGLIRRLAEPNLVALSGDTGEFLAGGKIPIPTAQSNAAGGAPIITTTFEEFGVKLTFTPTVLSNGLIHLQLRPEVSDVDTSIAVATGGGISIPGITIRRARTSVQLRDGQTFAIAGLLQTVADRNIDQVPWIGSIPVIGALFRSSAYRNRETELVMLVTPQLVKPGRPGDLITDPLETTAPPNDADFFLAGKLEIQRKKMHETAVRAGIKGSFGHVLPPRQPVPVTPAALR